jgi:multicomponent Na+:H+ antiporter subunit E
MAVLMAVLVISWVLWSGLYKPLVLALGLFSCVLSAYLAGRTGFFRHPMPLGSLLRLPGYWLWLLGEIIKSSIEVARLVLSPSLPINPTLVELQIDEKSDAGKVILGNSITLSPGTVTIDVHEGKLLVHCLTRKAAIALEQDHEIQNRVADLRMG